MNNLVKCSKTFLDRNASTILTCVGGAGVVVTSVLAVKATPKAMSLLEQAKAEKGDKLTKMEVVKVAGPAYIPSVVVGASTIACIFGANILNKRKQAALTSAYALLNSSYKEYKDKVNEIYGEDANDRIIAEIAKDKYDEDAITHDDNKQLFYDEFSGRYFESTMEEVIKAEYDLNRDLSNDTYVCLNEFYDHLGIDPIDGGDELGWCTSELFERCWSSWVDFHHKKTLIDDDLECYIITIAQEPIADYMAY